MNQSDLKPARDFAIQFGAKCLIYGGPGTGKTPLVSSAPRPVLLATEPGLLSMKTSTVPTWVAPTKARIDEFMKWFENSSEAKNFDTLAIDSVSQMCNIALDESSAKHGLAQYGDMADYVMPYLKRLYYTKQKHLYLICKEELTNDNKRRPSFPGKFLPIEIPHLYDGIFRLARVPIPNIGEQLAFQCNPSIDVVARNRTGTLSDFEPANFGDIVRKMLQ